jgi:hypothetical protein
LFNFFPFAAVGHARKGSRGMPTGKFSFLNCVYEERAFARKLMPVPLWKLLLKLKKTDSDTAMTCDDCFTILTCLADEVMRGTDAEILFQAAQEHLSRCARCREHHLQRLDELEASLAEKPEHNPGSRH